MPSDGEQQNRAGVQLLRPTEPGRDNMPSTSATACPTSVKSRPTATTAAPTASTSPIHAGRQRRGIAAVSEPSTAEAP